MNKTEFQSLSLAHETIQLVLRYKNDTLTQTDGFTYLGVTFDNKLSWKQVEKIGSQTSKQLRILKRLPACIWGCARPTVSTAYQKYVLPGMLHCCEALISSTDKTLGKLRKHTIGL